MTVSTTSPAPTGRPAAGGRSIRIGRTTYPVLLPQLRDPRLHVAAVIVSVQVLGQTSLGFDLSIAQILLCIGAAVLIEVTIVALTRKEIAWPASALLTANGAALILRAPHTVHGDWWSFEAWPMFVAVGGASLLSKYAIRINHRPLFNPSNFGLVLVFLVFGSRYSEPQDLWWGPWRPALAATVAIIVIGGLTLARRLSLFSVAITFWATFSAGIALLAARGHAITARWHLGPVADWSFWWVFVTSPEVIIFVFFMITDPRTAPRGRVARPVYAGLVGLVAAVLASLQRTEFATKVSLLAALTLVCAVRPWIERTFDEDRIAGRQSRWLRRVERPGRLDGLRPTALGAGAVVLIVAITGMVVVVAGARTRTARLDPVVQLAERSAGHRPEVRLPAGSVPATEADAALQDVSGEVGQSQPQKVARDLVEDLAIEGNAVRTGDAELAATAAFGDELANLRSAIRSAGRADRVTWNRYQIDRARLVLLRDPVNPQSIPQLGVLVRGTRTEVIGERGSDGRTFQQHDSPLHQLYLVTRVGDHFLIGRTLPPDHPMVVGGATLDP